MGNHEGMLLLLDLRNAAGDWDAKVMKEVHAGKRPEDLELLRWLAQRPVMDIQHGVLMMHAGLSESVLEIIMKNKKVKKACKKRKAFKGPTDPKAIKCGKMVVQHVNKKAKK